MSISRAAETTWPHAPLPSAFLLIRQGHRGAHRAAHHLPPDHEVAAMVFGVELKEAPKGVHVELCGRGVVVDAAAALAGGLAVREADT